MRTPRIKRNKTNMEIITEKQVENRKYWIDSIGRLSGNFGVDAERIEQELRQEIQDYGIVSLLGHLRLCGAIPESYGPDTSEEKRYSNRTYAKVISERVSSS